MGVEKNSNENNPPNPVIPPALSFRAREERPTRNLQYILREKSKIKNYLKPCHSDRATKRSDEESPVCTTRKSKNKKQPQTLSFQKENWTITQTRKLSPCHSDREPKRVRRGISSMYHERKVKQKTPQTPSFQKGSGKNSNEKKSTQPRHSDRGRNDRRGIYSIYHEMKPRTPNFLGKFIFLAK